MFFRKRHSGHTFCHSLERYADIHILFAVLILFFLFVILFAFHGARGAATTNFSMSVLPQPLAVNMVDSDFNPIEEPEVGFTEIPYTNDCRELITSLASEDQQIYVRNFDAADNGWTVTISTESPTAHWSSGEYAFDFNDPTGDGCADGDDPDTLVGSMEIYTESGSLDSWICPQCTSDFVNRVSAGAFDEVGGINSVTLVYATAGSDNRGDWRMSDVRVRQTIPASQPAAGNYEIPLLLSITAN
jgi:hypothetical protein